MMTLSHSADALNFSTTTKKKKKTKDEDCSISHGPLEKLSLSLVFASEREKSGRGFKNDGPGDVLSTPLTVRRREKSRERDQ